MVCKISSVIVCFNNFAMIPTITTLFNKEIHRSCKEFMMHARKSHGTRKESHDQARKAMAMHEKVMAHARKSWPCKESHRVGDF